MAQNQAAASDRHLTDVLRAIPDSGGRGGISILGWSLHLVMLLGNLSSCANFVTSSDFSGDIKEI
ncbi:MAG: hypothetical protein VKO39_10665 [Cyanobacteriota bacterium]|nr:hypothetical protein [Cyanobacteriota bacterium]